jgi:hypothetical protein
MATRGLWRTLSAFLGGIVARENRISAPAVYALIAAMSGPVPKMILTHVGL